MSRDPTTYVSPPMQEHMIETTLIDGLEHETIKRYIAQMKGRGWRIKSRSVVFERAGTATNADDLAVMQRAMAEEVSRIEKGGEPDPYFFDRMERMTARTFTNDGKPD